MSLRELITEYILFAFDEQSLMDTFRITEEELKDLSDIDLLEIYDQTMLFYDPESN